MVFQQFNLFPHMTILDNMTLAPMKLLGRPKDEAETEALKLLERVGLKEKKHPPIRDSSLAVRNSVWRSQE